MFNLKIKIYHSSDYLVRLFIDKTEYKKSEESSRNLSVFIYDSEKSNCNIRIIHCGKAKCTSIKSMVDNCEYTVDFDELEETIRPSLFEILPKVQYDWIFAQYECEICLRRNGIVEFECQYGKFIKNSAGNKMPTREIFYKNSNNIIMKNERKNLKIPKEYKKAYYVSQIIPPFFLCLPGVAMGIISLTFMKFVPIIISILFIALGIGSIAYFVYLLIKNIQWNNISLDF